MLTFLEIFKMLNIPNKRPPSFVLYNHSVCVLYETNHFGAKCEANAKITLRSHQPQLVSRNFSFGEGRTFKNGMKMKLEGPNHPCTLSAAGTSWTIIWTWMGNQLPIHDPILFSLRLNTLYFLPKKSLYLLSFI